MRSFMLICTLLCLVSGYVQAVCVTLNLTGITTSQVLPGGYDVFNGTASPQTVNFQVQSLATLAGCPYFIVLRAGQSGNGNSRYLSLGGNQLPYNVYTDSTTSNLLLPSGAGTAANAIVGNFPAAVGLTQTQNQNFVWKIPAQQIVLASASNYTDPGVVLELWEGVLGVLPVLRDTVALTFQAKVNTKVDLSIVGTGASFNAASTSRNLNFGTATTGANQSFDLSLRSNSGYSVTMQSTNGQKLVQTGVSSAIPYSVIVGGTAQNLTNGAAIPVASQTGTTTPLTGTNIPVKITLGTITGAETAGTYQDNLSIVLSAN